MTVRSGPGPPAPIGRALPEGAPLERTIQPAREALVEYRPQTPEQMKRAAEARQARRDEAERAERAEAERQLELEL